jgi:hypothetical protein
MLMPPSALPNSRVGATPVEMPPPNLQKHLSEDAQHHATPSWATVQNPGWEASRGWPTTSNSGGSVRPLDTAGMGSHSIHGTLQHLTANRQPVQHPPRPCGWRSSIAPCSAPLPSPSAPPVAAGSTSTPNHQDHSATSNGCGISTSALPIHHVPCLLPPRNASGVHTAVPCRRCCRGLWYHRGGGTSSPPWHQRRPLLTGHSWGQLAGMKAWCCQHGCLPWPWPKGPHFDPFCTA